MPSRMPAWEADMSAAEAHAAHREATSVEAPVAYAAEGVPLTDTVSIIEGSVVVLTSVTLVAVASENEDSGISAMVPGAAAGITAALVAGEAGAAAGIMVAGTTGIIHPGLAAMRILSMCPSIMAAMGIMGAMAMMREPVMKLVLRRGYTRLNSVARCVITRDPKKFRK